MLILETAIGVAAVYLLGRGDFGFAATALIALAFLLWWDGQPGPLVEQEVDDRPEERPAAKHPKWK